MEIKERIKELEAELSQRQQRLQQAQAIAQQEAQAIISINGGIMELRKLLPPAKEKEKSR